MKKPELIQMLVDEYGYDKEDLKDSEGKLFTNAKLKAMIEAEKAEAEDAERDAHRVVAPKGLGLKDEDKISVMSGSSGTVIYRSGISNRKWRFNKFGQMDKLPYAELVNMHNNHPKFFTNGLIVVLDKLVQDEFGLTEMYNNILTPDNIDEIYNKPIDELKLFVKNLPDGMKHTFINKTQDLYNSNKLKSLEVVRMIEEEFGFSLDDNAPINDFAVKGDLGRDNIIYVDKK